MTYHEPPAAIRRLLALSALAVTGALAWGVLGSCARQTASRDDIAPTHRAEILYAEARVLRDQIDVTNSRGMRETPSGVALAELVERYGTAHARLASALAPKALAAAPASDTRAIEVMRRTLDGELALGRLASNASPEPAPDCDYDPERIADGPDGEQALARRIYACFSRSAGSLSFEGEEMDRLTIFGRLALTDDPARREALWRALAPVWEAVDGRPGAPSPYRTLVRVRAARLRERGVGLGESVRSIGVEPVAMERWLLSVLETWHAITPDVPIQPWDFGYRAGRASRALQQRVPLPALRPINDRYYRDLGADPIALNVHYDLAPRATKDPVAFTSFGRRPRLDGDATIPGEPWVFASYRIGGLDNLAELLHETGHAIHIAAIRTRPAFADWPDSDVFTEAVADIASHEMYEPAWQQRYLGDSVPIEMGIAAKYASIAMDVAWSLFELQLYRDPARDPGEVWTEITERYFRIRPHPDLAWWAVRGQLIDAPGYMMNYAAGAILVADLRARLRELYGPWERGDPGWYRRVSEALYRFGLERTSEQVILDLLGRPVSPQALLDDLARAKAGA